MNTAPETPGPEDELMRHSVDSSSRAHILGHLRANSPSFIPPLERQLVLEDYATKLRAYATTFEIWAEDVLVALLAAYLNRPETGTAFIALVSTLPAHRGRGFASSLIEHCAATASQAGFRELVLETHPFNAGAQRIYHRAGFTLIAATEDVLRFGRVCVPRASHCREAEASPRG